MLKQRGNEMNTTVVAAKERKKMKNDRKKQLVLLSMCLPTAIWLILLRYIPMFGIVMAFQKYKIYSKDPSLINNILKGSEWVGFKNFGFLFATTDTLKIIRNTVCYNLVWILIGMIVSVTFAVMLNEITNKFCAKTYQTMMFFPYFISWVVASYFVVALIDPANGLITRLQIQNSGVATNWFNDTKPWPFILTLANVWKNTGYSTILYLAAITGIDKSLYEAGAIDGATKWQQIKYITIPNLRTMITILLIMDVGKIFNSDFGLFYNIPQNSGPLYSVTQTLDTYVYRALARTQEYGMSTAASLFQNVVGFICIMTANSVVKRIDPDSRLF